MRYGKAILIFLAMSFWLQADAQNVRLSFKLLANPASGNTPAWVNEQWIDDCMDWINDIMGQHGRGISFSRESTLTVSTVFFNDTVNTDTKNALEAAAEANPSFYLWRNNRINIYLSSGPGSGVCSFPESDEIILIGPGNLGFSTVLHEIGHFFNLCHTQGCPCGSCDSDESGECNDTPGDDEIADTLPDLSCWDQDDIANNSYNLNYSQLSAANQEIVDNVFFNIMSYHGNRARLTEGQLDRWVQAIYDNGNRRDVVSGDPIYLDDDASCTFIASCVLCDGEPEDPYDDLMNCGFPSANSGSDIIVLKPGTYNIGNEVITTPCIIAGTKAGDGVVR